MRSGAAMTLAAILFVSMMINLASPPSQINSDAIKFNTDYGDPIDYEIEWHPFDEVGGDNRGDECLDCLKNLSRSDGISLTVSPCHQIYDFSPSCTGTTAVSVTLERPAKHMYVQFYLGDGGAPYTQPDLTSSHFHVQNHITNVWDNVYSHSGFHSTEDWAGEKVWEVITLSPQHYNEENTLNISFSIHNENHECTSYCPLVSSWVSVFFVEDLPMDRDGDGVLDSEDAFPNDPQESVDSDGDGVGDYADIFPNDPNETADSDGDGVGDNLDDFPHDPNEDTDSDDDGLGDNEDDFPDDPTEWQDWDEDGVGDNTDAFPLDSTEWLDSDGDGVGENTDAFPLDSTEWLDSDFDRVGNNADLFPLDPTEWLDSDGDGVGANSDGFPEDPTRTMDRDGDGWAVEEEGAILDNIHENNLPIITVAYFCIIIGWPVIWNISNKEYDYQ